MVWDAKNTINGRGYKIKMKKIIETPDFYKLLGIKDDVDSEIIETKLEDLKKSVHYSAVKKIIESSELKMIYDSNILETYREDKKCEWYYWGLIYILAGEYQKAIKYLSNIDPDSDDIKRESVFLSLAVAYKELEEFADAIKYFKNVLEENPDNIDAITSLLEVFYNGEEFEEFEYYSQHAIKIIHLRLCDLETDFNSKKDLYKSLIKIHMYCEDDENSEKAIHDMIKMDETDIDSLLVASSYYFELGSFESALTFLKKAEKIDPASYRILLELGFVFFELNLPGLAVIHFKKAKKINKVEKEVDMLINKINELRKANGETVEEFIYIHQEKFYSTKNKSEFTDATVLFFDNEKGFGFANPVNKSDIKVFIHFFAMENSDMEIEKGDSLQIIYAKKDKEFIAYLIKSNDVEETVCFVNTGEIKSIFEKRNYGIIEFENDDKEKEEAIFFINSISNIPSGKLKIGQKVKFSLEKKELDSGKIVYSAIDVTFL